TCDPRPSLDGRLRPRVAAPGRTSRLFAAAAPEASEPCLRGRLLCGATLRNLQDVVTELIRPLPDPLRRSLRGAAHLRPLLLQPVGGPLEVPARDGDAATAQGDDH